MNIPCRSLSTFILALALTNAAAATPQVYELSSATNVFAPSFRGATGSLLVGWDSFDDSLAGDMVINDSTPDLGNSPGSFVCNNGESHISGSLNLYTSNGSLDETATFDTQGTLNSGFTTIIIQGATVFGPFGAPIAFTDIAGLPPVENLQADNAVSAQFWIKYEIPGNEASYSVTLTTGANSFISLDLITIDTFWSPTDYAPDTAIIELPAVYTSLCFGDGGNQMGCTNCPCGNNAMSGALGGCLNSAGTSATLAASGSASVSLPSGGSTDLRFEISGAPAGAFCILNSGDGIAPGNMANPCFGINSGAQATAFDGLRCAIANTRRHGGRSADANGDVGVMNSPWGGEGGPPVGIALAGGGFTTGQTRFFQVVNRDDALSVCMRGLNTSQAIEVTFEP